MMCKFSQLLVLLSSTILLLLCLLGSSRAFLEQQIEDASNKKAPPCDNKKGVASSFKNKSVDKWFLASVQGREEVHNNKSRRLSSQFLEEVILDVFRKKKKNSMMIIKKEDDTAGGLSSSNCDESIDKVTVVLPLIDSSDATEEARRPVHHYQAPSHKTNNNNNNNNRSPKQEFFLYIHAEGFACGECEGRKHQTDYSEQQDYINNKRILEEVNAELIRLLGSSDDMMIMVGLERLQHIPPTTIISSNNIGEEGVPNTSTTTDTNIMEEHLVTTMAFERRNLQASSCAGEVIPFIFRTIIELNQACGALSENDKTSLTGTYVLSFNGLADKYCDPYFRQVETATIVNEGTVTDEGKLGIEVEVTGTLYCLETDDESCNVVDIGLYDIPPGLDLSSVNNNTRRRTSRRHLQDTNCTCPVDPIADRAIQESELIGEFQARLANTTSTLDCPNLSVSECDFGAIFDSAIEVTFADGAAARALPPGELEAKALAILNTIFAANDPETCDPEFRVFNRVEVIFQDERRLGTMGAASLLSAIEVEKDEESKRAAAGHDRQLQQEAPSSSPSLSQSPTASASPTSLDVPVSSTGQGGLPVILLTYGVCRGCSNDLFTLSNQLNGRKRALFEEKVLKAKAKNKSSSSTTNVDRRPDDPVLQRELADIEATSNCFCGLDTTIVVTPPKIEEFETALETSTGLNITTTRQVLNDFIYTYPCTTEVSPLFQKNITLELQYTCAGTGTTDPEFTDEVKSEIAAAFVRSYASLQGTVCDPFDRRVKAARVIKLGDLRAEGTSIPFELELDLECNGCDINTVEVYGFPTEEERSLPENAPVGGFGRRLGRLRVPRKHRRVEDQTTCECDVDLPRRAVLEADVTDALDPILQTLTTTTTTTSSSNCIGNTTQCDFGRNFATNILLEVQLDDSLTPEETAQILKEAYVETLSALVSGGNETQCNDLFGFVTDSEFFLNFVYNSLEVGSNGTETPERRLSRMLQDQQQQTLDPSVFEDDLLFLNVSFEEDLLFLNVSSSAPSSAPTTPPTAFVLLTAYGVCNGCPRNFFGSNQVSGRRMMLGSLADEHPDIYEDWSSFDPSLPRFLQIDPVTGLETTTDGPESDCYCPIGSIPFSPQLNVTLFVEDIQTKVSELNNQLMIVGEPEVDLSQVDCSKSESVFTIDTLKFEFSAYQWVTLSNNVGDLQGLGNAIAAAYNSLVPQFCDEYFRSAISLTYKTGSARRLNSSTRRQNVRGRDLQQTAGCFNYVAEFSVTGICRDCQALGSPIPLFGNSSVTRERELLEFLDFDDLDEGRSGPDASHRPRRLETATCFCDAFAQGQKRAPSLAEVKAVLQTVFGTAPWDAHPSICGLPVATEVQCPATFTGTAPTVQFDFSYSFRRTDGQCVTAADIDAISAAVVNRYNNQKRAQVPFPCDPKYNQIAMGTPVNVASVLAGGCRRRVIEDDEAEGDVPGLHGRRRLVTDYYTVSGLFQLWQSVLGNSQSALEEFYAFLTTVMNTIRSDGTFEIRAEKLSRSPSSSPSLAPTDPVGFCSDEATPGFPIIALTAFKDIDTPIVDSKFAQWYDGTCAATNGADNFVMYNVAKNDVKGGLLYLDIAPEGNLPDFELSVISYDGETCGDLGCDKGDALILQSDDFCSYNQDLDSVCCEPVDVPDDSLVALTSSANFNYRLHGGDALCFDPDLGFVYQNIDLINCPCGGPPGCQGACRPVWTNQPLNPGLPYFGGCEPPQRRRQRRRREEEEGTPKAITPRENEGTPPNGRPQRRRTAQVIPKENMFFLCQGCAQGKIEISFSGFDGAGGSVYLSTVRKIDKSPCNEITLLAATEFGQYACVCNLAPDGQEDILIHMNAYPGEIRIVFEPGVCNCPIPY